MFLVHFYQYNKTPFEKKQQLFFFFHVDTFVLLPQAAVELADPFYNQLPLHVQFSLQCFRVTERPRFKKQCVPAAKVTSRKCKLIGSLVRTTLWGRGGGSVWEWKLWSNMLKESLELYWCCHCTCFMIILSNCTDMSSLYYQMNVF